MAEGQRSVQEILQFLTTEHFTLVPAGIGAVGFVISWLALDTLSTRGVPAADP